VIGNGRTLKIALRDASAFSVFIFSLNVWRRLFEWGVEIGHSTIARWALAPAIDIDIV